MAERKWFKGRAAQALDGWFSEGVVETNLTDAQDLLLRDESFEAIVRELRNWDREQYTYPHRPELQGVDFERVMRQGYLEAIALARRHSPSVPITTFWMTGVGNDTFELHVTDGTEQVAVTLLIPNAEGGTHEEGSPESWVVTINGDGQVDVEQTSGPRDRERPSTTASD